MHLKCLRVAIFLISLRLIKCDFYCDDNVGICLYTNFTDRVTSWDDARTHCSRNGSILLELYDKNYEAVALHALSKFNLQNWYLLFGLEFKNGQFRWLTTGIVKNFEIQVVGNFHEGNFACLIFSGSKLRIEPFINGITQFSRFVCLKDNNIHSTVHITELTSNQHPRSGFTIPSSTEQSQLDEHQQPHNNNIGVGVGVGVALLAILTIIIAAIIVIIKKRRLSDRNENACLEVVKSKKTTPTTNPSNESIVYADLDFIEKSLESKKNDHPMETPNVT